jgi:cytochrome c oxidase cbb3-type subunit 3
MSGRTAGRTAVAVLVGCLAGSCASSPPDFASEASPPASVEPVGPVPGTKNANATSATNPFAGDRMAAGQGRQLFIRFNCVGCHGGRAGGGMGPSLRDVDWLYGDTDAQIFSSIAEGRAHGMPSWQRMLTNGQTWMLVSYIKSLRTRAEPQSPPPE